MDTACLQRLTELDTAVNELRSRAAKLARREAERVELLERAEAAWKDLELGYQRRLNLAQEKEDDIANQVTILLFFVIKIMSLATISFAYKHSSLISKGF